MELSDMDRMGFEWIGITGPSLNDCSLIHPEHGCSTDIGFKAINVAGKASRYYLIIHGLSLLVRLFKRSKRNSQKGPTVSELIRKTGLSYVKSIIFMVQIVLGIKIPLCLIHRLPRKAYDKFSFLSTGLITGSAILWEQESRRHQIVMFTLVRALTAVYSGIKKRGYFQIPNDSTVAFVVIFGLLSYIFMEQPQLATSRNIMQELVGET